MPTQRIPLVGSLINRNARPTSYTAYDQLFINCFPEVDKNPITGQGIAYLNKRSGFDKSGNALGTGTAGSYGFLTWSGSASGIKPLLSVYDLANTKTGVFDVTGGGSGTQIGGYIATTNACFHLSETSISAVANIVGYFRDSSTSLYEAWFFPEGGAWTQITDGDFPPNIGTPEPLATGSGPAHLDGYMFVMTTNGKVWNSDLNSVVNWTANSYITAQSSPDGGVGIAKYKNLIVGFGTRTIEFFQNLGNSTGSPLANIPSATINIGARQLSIYRCILNVGDTVYFIGIEPVSGRTGIYRLNGYQAEKISNPFIEKLMNDSTGSPIAGFAGAMFKHGQTHIFMMNGSDLNRSFVYCVDTDLWWINETTGNQQPWSIVAAPLNSGASTPYYVSTIDAKVFSSASNSFADEAAYTMTVQTANLDQGTMKRKSYDRIRIVGDIQASASALGVSYSDNDYSTFSSVRNIDMGNLDAVGKGLIALGSARRRAWKFTHSANTPFRAEAVELDYTVTGD